jgi:hypothetical protein
MNNLPAAGFIFMKVGIHDGEDFECIVARKKEEISKTGMSFWGYGGSSCHPLRQVQPFAKQKREMGETIFLIMEEIHSNHQATNLVANEYSQDGINWSSIPDGIQVRGSRYALVLGEIQSSDLEIDLSRYNIAHGPSTGKIASNYIKGRTDKACIALRNSGISIDSPVSKHISFMAPLVEPYAVLVR